MNLMKETWMKGLARAGSRAGGTVLLQRFAPLYGEDNEAATRQYNVAVSLQNREAYDLAVDAWGSFIQTIPRTRVSPSAALPGRLLFFYGGGRAGCQTDRGGPEIV